MDPVAFFCALAFPLLSFYDGNLEDTFIFSSKKTFY